MAAVSRMTLAAGLMAVFVAAGAVLILAQAPSDHAPVLREQVPVISTDAQPFRDEFLILDRERWSISHGWRNGDWTINDWRRSSVEFGNGLVLTLSSSKHALAAYSSGEVQSRGQYGHGYYEATLKAASGSGLVTGFFTYTGPAFGTEWDEIDVEILGSRPTELMMTYFRDGQSVSEYVDLGFDATAGFHRYGFDWQPDAITWYVDGQKVHQVSGDDLPLPRLPQKLMVSLWGSGTLTDWLGNFDPANVPVSAHFSCISYSSSFAARSDCR